MLFGFEDDDDLPAPIFISFASPPPLELQYDLYAPFFILVTILVTVVAVMSARKLFNVIRMPPEWANVLEAITGGHSQRFM